MQKHYIPFLPKVFLIESIARLKIPVAGDDISHIRLRILPFFSVACFICKRLNSIRAGY